MQYKVYKQFPRDDERLFAQFNDLADAKFFIEKKVEADSILKMKVIYRLYKGHDLLEEVNSDSASSGGADQSTGRATSNGVSAAPSPFSTTPKPAGAPSKWGSVGSKDEDEKK